MANVNNNLYELYSSNNWNYCIIECCIYFLSIFDEKTEIERFGLLIQLT